MQRQAVFGLLFAFALFTAMFLTPRVFAVNGLVNGDFETGSFFGWTVSGKCYINSGSPVHGGSYSAFISSQSDDSVITQVVYGSQRLSVGDGIILDGWVFPTKVGYLGDLEYPCSVVDLTFYDESTEQQAFQIWYEWSATSLHQSYSWIKFVNMEANAWNHMVVDVASDVRSAFPSVADYANIVLYSVGIRYHYSNGDPGSFFADDFQVYAGTIVPPPVSSKPLSMTLYGSFDYGISEQAKIKVFAEVRDPVTMVPISGVNVSIQVFDPNDTLWVSDSMVESPSETGIYEWESADTVANLQLQVGVYLAHVVAMNSSSSASGIEPFHIDPPPSAIGTISLQLYLATILTLVFAGILTVLVLFRKLRMSARTGIK